MSGNGNEYGGARRNADKQPDQKQYDPVGNPIRGSATYPTGSLPHALPQGSIRGYVTPQPPNIFMGGFPQEAPNPHGFSPSEQMGGHHSHFSQGMPPHYGPHENLPPNPSILMTMNSPWPSIQGNMYGQPPPYPAMQNSLPPSAGVRLPPLLPQGAFTQPSSMSTGDINQSHTLVDSASNMQQAVSAPPLVPNPPILPDLAAAFDDDFIHPRTGRPTRPFLPHEQALLRQYYRLKHPLAPNATDREIQMWHVRLRYRELTEWDKFLDDNESKSEASERKGAIEDYEEWINDIKQCMRDEIRSDARGNVYGRLGRAPGSKNKPKTGTLSQGAGVKKTTSKKGGSALKGKQSAQQQDSEIDDDDNDEDAEGDDDSDTIVVETPKKGMSKGKSRASTPKKSAKAAKTKNSGKNVVAEAFEEEEDEEEAVEEDDGDNLGQNDPHDMDDFWS